MTLPLLRLRSAPGEAPEPEVRRPRDAAGCAHRDGC